MQSNIIQYRKRGSVLPKTKHGPQPFAVEGRFSFICYLSSVRGLETLVFRFDEAVFPVFPFVNDADGIGLGIEEYEEVVADEVHLQDSFFDVHGTSGKFLDTSDFKRFFRYSRAFDEGSVEGTFLHAAGDSRLVFMNLADQLIVD